MQEQPLVSVLMTVYNREKYIAEAVKSVIESSYKNWELIIVDDQSKDESLNIAQAFAAEDDRIKVYRNEENLGDYPNRNRAASYAQGKYLKYLDSDDLIYPYSLEIMVNGMENHPDAGMGFTYNNYENENKFPIYFNESQTFKNHFFVKGILYIGPSGGIYRKDFFEELSGFNPVFKVASDYDFSMRAAGKRPILLFQRDLIWWRQHEGQQIITGNKNNDYVIHNYIITTKNIKDANISEELKTIILRNNDILMARRLIKLIPSTPLKKIKDIMDRTKFPISNLLKCIHKIEFPRNANN